MARDTARASSRGKDQGCNVLAKALETNPGNPGTIGISIEADGGAEEQWIADPRWAGSRTASSAYSAFDTLLEVGDLRRAIKLLLRRRFLASCHGVLFALGHERLLGGAGEHLLA
jgi:hypothetical protein